MDKMVSIKHETFVAVDKWYFIFPTKKNCLQMFYKCKGVKKNYPICILYFKIPNRALLLHKPVESTYRVLTRNEGINFK